MGADFFFAIVTTFGNRPMKDRQTAMHAALATLSPDALKANDGLWETCGLDSEWVFSIIGRNGLDPEFDTDLDGWPAHLSADKQRQVMATVIDNYVDTEGWRAVGSTTVLGIGLDITGEMSYGDTPEAVTVFERFNLLPAALLEAGGFASPHDAFLARLIAEYPDKLPEAVRAVLDSYRVVLAL